MTETQKKKILHLEFEIRGIEDKVDRLLRQRAMLADQIQKIQNSLPKQAIAPSDEQRALQSQKDKEAHQLRLKQYSRVGIKKLDLSGFSQNK